MQAHFSVAPVESILSSATRIKRGQAVTVKQVKSLLGLMADNIPPSARAMETVDLAPEG